MPSQGVGEGAAFSSDRLYYSAYDARMPEVNPIILPDAFLMAIGRVMVNWSQLEGILDFVLIKLLGAYLYDERYHAVFAQMMFQAKIETLQSVTDILQRNEQNAGAHARFKEIILPKLTDLQGRRNGIVHCKWAVHDETVSITRLQARGKLHIKERNISLEEITKMADEIALLSEELWNMVDFPEFHQALPT